MQMWRAEPSPGADVAGASPVPVQMWHGVSPVLLQMCDFIRAAIHANNPSLVMCDLLKYCDSTEYVLPPS